ncbi:hypothetical protein [uncultured Gammaproteobacteria bacterium]|nr:hypothetical protein [uncultured Gammaproteobacteria bacterium]
MNWYFFKLCPSKAKAGFKKITKLVKSGFLMIIHIYAKVFHNAINRRAKLKHLYTQYVIFSIIITI